VRPSLPQNAVCGRGWLRRLLEDLVPLGQQLGVGPQALRAGHGRMKILAALTEPEAIRKILKPP
jgi:hypothetical protein